MNNLRLIVAVVATLTLGACADGQGVRGADIKRTACAVGTRVCAAVDAVCATSGGSTPSD